MEFETIRSRRDPACWLPLVVVLTALIPLALWAHSWTEGYRARLEALAREDARAAALLAEQMIWQIGWIVFGFTLVVGVLLIRYFQLALREGRLPPSGLWSLGSHRAVVGRSARRRARLGLGVTVILPLAGVGFLISSYRLIELLRPG